MPSAFADDGIELPVTEARTVFDDAGACLNGDPVAQVAAPVIGSVPFLVGLLAAEMPGEDAILGLILKHILIDPFVTDGDGLLSSPPKTDLLGTPVLLQQTLDQAPG